MEASIPIWAKQAIFWLSFLYFPVALALVWAVLRQPRVRWFALLALVPLSVLAYARFVEPHRLVVAEHTVEVCGDGLPGTLTAAIVGDFHVGLYSNAPSLRRIVDRINRSDADFVLIPGDFTYHLPPARFSKAFAPLRDLEAPAYAVLGNHDVGIPGEDLSGSLAKVLEGHGVDVLYPGQAIFGKEGKFVRIVGFRDYWAYTRRSEPLGVYPDAEGMPIIFLQHNPDMIKEPGIGAYDLFVSGHTHGGQIYVPGLTCEWTFACDTLRYGYADTPVGKLFVTSGTGTTGLPMRFGVPPRIDLVTMQLNRCRIKTWDRPRINAPGKLTR
jgi:predicted MPP superfamily phosphohydrolase